MKSYRYCLLFSLIWPIREVAFAQQKHITVTTADLTAHVDPFIGTGLHGHVFLGANVPFGAVQLGPVNIAVQTWDWCSGYNYTDSTIAGFAHTHLSGTGIGDLGDIQFMPTTGGVKTLKGDLNKPESGYCSIFSHRDEVAQPGYYAVQLKRYDIGVELTTTTRVGFQRYTFPQSKDAHIIIDLQNGIGWDHPVETYIVLLNDSTVTGYRYSSGWAAAQRIYFAAVFSKHIKNFSVYDSLQLVNSTAFKGRNVKGIISFTTTENEQVEIKVGISPVSMANALLNIKAETPTWDFNKVRNEARKLWESEFEKVVIKADTQRMRTFYTALYHTMIAPSVFNDSNGDYWGADKKVHHKAPFTNVTTLSLWDTYRAQNPLMTLLQPERTNNLINSMLAIYKQQGRLPVWHLMANETDCMVGNSAIPVVADAFLKGYRGFDTKLAYDAVKKTAMGDRRGLKFVKKQGYIPADTMVESVATGLEYAIDDWCIAQMALKIGNKTDYKYFSKRAKNYCNYFDKQTHFMRGRISQTAWRTPFSPFVSRHMKDDFTEGNAWQYTWLVPQDVEGLIQLQGGEKAFVSKLDSLFIAQGDMGAEASNDISGLIGQYAQGNEPSHHIAYLYNYVGQPWKTAEKVRYIMDNFYTNKKDGIIGNEDVGQMSAWYVLSALGFYPVNPANGAYVFGSPIINEATLKLADGKSFHIRVENNIPGNQYIQSMQLNGTPYSKSFILHHDIIKGGALIITMGNKPGATWAVSSASRPTSNTFNTKAIMKRISILLFTIIPLFTSAQHHLKLWYKQPAKVWTEALPVGNGRLAAMVFGGINEEHIQLNEGTLWSGGPVKTNINPDAPKYLAAVRDVLIKKHDYAEATRLERKMQGLYTESYLPLGDLFIKQQFRDTNQTSYYRDLDIANAISTTRFTCDGVTYRREIFSSAADQVIVIRFTANKPGALNLKISSGSLLRHQMLTNGNNSLILKGKAPTHADPSYYTPNNHPVQYNDTDKRAGMRFELIYKALNDGGTVVADTSGIIVKNATSLSLLVSGATSFNGFDHRPDKNEHLSAQNYLTKATAKPYTVLRCRHIADYQKYFHRVSFNIQSSILNPNAALPTDERINAYTAGASDPDYETLYFQYGRYLLISSSRPGGTAANLQGIWNDELRPPWSSNYTININTEMNYWPAEVTNLSEIHQPLFKLIKNLSVTGKTTAKQFYNMGGWVAHHNTDIWAASNPVGDKGQGDPKWANWAMGGNWLCQDLWEHYCFTQDKVFLKSMAYPIMKSAALFCLDWLMEDKDGYLVTAPSLSPENDYIDADGKHGEVSVASTMDMSIIYDLFSNLIAASQKLGTDDNFRKLIIAKRDKLYPLHIGHLGNLQEWYQDFKDTDPQHRHVSHLFSLHPGKRISPITTPELATAARKTLEIRGDDGTGWSLAWKINFWARLLDGNHAHLLIRELLKSNSGAQTDIHHGGGVYPNMFDSCPPFQIDGNFGGTAGIAEMLIQSHQNEIYLIPALPDAWANGAIKGLKARGGFQVDMTWSQMKLMQVKVLSLSGGVCTIRSANKLSVKGMVLKQHPTNYGYVVSFPTKKGRSYHLYSL